MSNFKDDRLKLCQSCEHLDCKWLKPSRCSICGCLVSLKAAIKSESCPMGYWKAIESKD